MLKPHGLLLQLLHNERLQHTTLTMRQQMTSSYGRWWVNWQQ
jgi:hypothetical protein